MLRRRASECKGGRLQCVPSMNRKRKADQHEEQEEQEEEELEVGPYELLTCAICQLRSRHVFFQPCGHVLCFACRYKDLISGRGLARDDIKENDRPFRIAQAIWGIDHCDVRTVVPRLEYDFPNLNVHQTITFQGCPLCKKSRTNLFALATVDYAVVPNFHAPVQEGDIESCWHCEMKFPPTLEVRQVQEHLFRTCPKMSFQCPLNAKCQITSHEIQLWLRDDRRKVKAATRTRSRSKDDLVKSIMLDLLAKHVRAHCRVIIVCPYCLESIEGSCEMKSHIEKERCDLQEKVREVEIWAKNGLLQGFENKPLNDFHSKAKVWADKQRKKLCLDDDEDDLEGD